MQPLSRGNGMAVAMLVLSAAGVAAFSGLVIGFGGLRLGVIFSALICGLGVLFLPLDLLVVSTMLVSTVGAGSVEYFAGGWKYAHWISFGLAFACLLRVPIELIKVRARNPLAASNTARHRSWPMALLGLYLVVGAVSSLLNLVPFVQLLVTFKNIVVMWSIAILISNGALKPNTLRLLWQLLIPILIIQLPVAVYQHFFVAAKRAAGHSEYDAVAGTFGGNPARGGSNPTLVLFAMCCALYAVALYNAKRLRLWATFILVCIALAVIGLGEVKAAIVLMPVACAALYADKLVRRPRILIGWSLATLAFVTGMLLLYQSLYWSKIHNGYRDIGSSLRSSLKYMTDPNNIDMRTGEVGRVASINLWLRDVQSDGAQRLIGHGAGASRGDSSIAVGAVARKYAPLDLSATAVSQLLWDFGVLGLATYAALLVTGLFSAGRAVRDAIAGSAEEAVLRTSRVVLLLALLYLPYNKYLLDQAAVQFLLCLSLGCVVLARRGGLSLGQSAAPQAVASAPAARSKNTVMRPGRPRSAGFV